LAAKLLAFEVRITAKFPIAARIPVFSIPALLKLTGLPCVKIEVSLGFVDDLQTKLALQSRPEVQLLR
jgi:hypothetical protein